jgi:hypothetical protein
MSGPFLALSLAWEGGVRPAVPAWRIQHSHPRRFRQLSGLPAACSKSEFFIYERPQKL